MPEIDVLILGQLKSLAAITKTIYEQQKLLPLPNAYSESILLHISELSEPIEEYLGNFLNDLSEVQESVVNQILTLKGQNDALLSDIVAELSKLITQHGVLLQNVSTVIENLNNNMSTLAESQAGLTRYVISTLRDIRLGLSEALEEDLAGAYDNADGGTGIDNDAS